jgi:OOP family OmpA-OmpF porin
VTLLGACRHTTPAEKPEPAEPAAPPAPETPKVDSRVPPDASVKRYPDIGEKPKVSISEAEFIQFVRGSARLNRASRRALDKMAEMIKSGPGGGVVRVEGHCDRTEKNKAILSLKRARAVRRYLIGKGVPAERLKAIGLGSTKPLAAGGSAADLQQNRRVDFTFKEESL